MTPTPDALTMAVAAAHRVAEHVDLGLWWEGLDVEWRVLPPAGGFERKFVVWARPLVYEMTVRV